MFSQFVETARNNPFTTPVSCESSVVAAGDASSIIPGRDIAAAAGVSNVILEGGELMTLILKECY